MKQVLTLSFLALTLLGSSPLQAANDTVQGYKRPDVCLKTNIRCILKEVNGKKYWCLKSSIQRNLDARHNAHPLSRTFKTNMGNCAKMLDAEIPN